MKNTLIFILFIFITQLPGAVGSFFTSPGSSEWYAELVKPALSPPNWVFAPVWLTLYVLMGIACFLVWRKGWPTQKAKWALGIFIVHLFFNGIWSIFYFGFQNIGLALMDIIVLAIFILISIILFARVSKMAALLLVPYLLWVFFATYLNAMLFILN